MKIPAMHPAPLMYPQMFLRLEPLGLDMVAEEGGARRLVRQVANLAGLRGHSVFFAST